MLDKLDYFFPESFSEASQFLKEHPYARAVLGGTDLIVFMTKTETEINELLDLTHIPGIDKAYEDDSFYYFGAGYTHAQTVEWAKSHEAYAAFGEAAISIGTPQVRNIATLVGNVCNAVPSCDMGAPSLIFQVQVKVVSTDGEKWMDMKDLFAGPKKNSLAHHELISEYRIPKADKNTVSDYKKFGPRKASDLAYVGVATKLIFNEDKSVKDICIGLGAVAPTPVLVSGTEQLIGKKVDEAFIAQCVQLAKDSAKPITDFRATDEYRLQIIGVETQRSIEDCLKKAQ